MPAEPADIRRASDPATDPQTLADLVAAHPELHPVIAANPATYPALRDWLRENGGEDTRRVLAAAHPVPPPPPTIAPTAWMPMPPPVHAQPAPAGPPRPTGTPFREPARDAPLAWGTYEARYALALVALALAGVWQIVRVLIAGTLFDGLIDFGIPVWYDWLVLGFWDLTWVLIAAAMAVVPTTPRRRILAVALPLAVLVVSSATWFVDRLPPFDIVFGALYALYCAVPVVSWFVARMRPPVVLALLPVVLILPILSQVFRWTWTHSEPFFLSPFFFGLASAALTMVGVAWIARAMAATLRS